MADRMKDGPDAGRRTAVALGFEPGDEAPKILATGHGHVADKIIAQAQEAGVPLHKDKKLAETLSKMDFGDYIPPELYQVVVDILTYVDRIDSVKAKMESNKKGAGSN